MRTTLIFIVILLSNIGFSQEIMMKNYRNEDGLPSNETFHIMQDSKGYIWIGTNMGVSKFDGYSFENFDSNSGLEGNTILDIYEDYKGRIWFISLNAKLSYYYNDSIHSYKHNDKLISAIERSPVPLKRSFYVDTADNVYYSIRPLGILKIEDNGDIKTWSGWSENKNYILDFENKTLVSNLRKESPTIEVHKKNVLKKKVKNPTLKDGSRWLTFVQRIAPENYYITNTSSVISIKDSTTNIVYQTDDGYIIDFITEEDNTVWLSVTNNGVKQFSDPGLSKVKQHLLKGHSVSTIFKDKDGGYWFSTLNNGVYYASGLFVHVLKEGFFGNSDPIVDILKTDNKILLFSKQKRMLVAKIRKDGRFSKLNTYDYSNNQYDVLNSIAAANGDVYLAGNLNLQKVSLSENKYQGSRLYVKIQETSWISTAGIKTVYKSKDGQLYLGNAANFLKVVGQEKDTLYVNRKARFRTSCIIPDYDKNKLWLGSLYGLYEYNIKKDLLTYHGKYSERLKTRISDIAVVDSETIACGTRGNGIILYNHKEQSVEAINKKSGLNSHFISTLFLRDSLLWAGTNKGVNIINLQNSDTPVRHLTQSSGLCSDQINKIRMIDSTVYIATSKGVSYFNPDKLVQDTSSLTIYIQEITNFEGRYQEDQSINIPYPKNTIGFRYSPLVYNHNKNLKYRYRIKGLDKKWQYTKSNEVFFPFIPGGDYIFEITVRNKDGIWSKSLTRVPFTIEKPYWRTAWFYVSTGVVVLIFLAIIALLFINNRKIKNEAQQSIIKYQQYALSNQMNPHFLYNSLNSIHRYLLENNPIYASKYLARFARLMRLFLDNSNHEFISLNKEIEMIEIYLELELLRMKGAFSYNINVNDEIDGETTLIPAMILQPFVENAVLHGIRYLQNEKGNIQIAFKTEKEHLTITVEDNGVGMAKAQELEIKNKHTSYGGAIVKKRLALLNQLYGFNILLNFIDLQNEDHTFRGTKVIIKNIPMDLKNV